MALRILHGRPMAEDVSDVEAWLSALTGCPEISSTRVAGCANHGDEDSNWFYVEADPHEGIARLRCIGCGRVHHLLDSEERWSYPATWSCPGCQHSIAEVVLGAHEVDTGPDWVAIAVRCVECGHVEGVTDAVIAEPGTAFDSLFSATPTPVA